MSQLIAFKEAPLGQPVSSCEEARRRQGQHSTSHSSPSLTHSCSLSASHLLVDEEGFKVIRDLQRLNPKANNVLELYHRPKPCDAGRPGPAGEEGGEGTAILGNKNVMGGFYRWLFSAKHELLYKLAWEEDTEYAPGSVWHSVVVNEHRCNRQKRLREAFTALQVSGCLLLKICFE